MHKLGIQGFRSSSAQKVETRRGEEGGATGRGAGRRALGGAAGSQGGRQGAPQGGGGGGGRGSGSRGRRVTHGGGKEDESAVLWLPAPPRPGRRPQLTLGRAPEGATLPPAGPGLPQSGGALGPALGVFSFGAGASGGDFVRVWARARPG